MIENFNRKRMFIGIVLLGGLTIFGLIVESHLTSQHHNFPTVSSNTSKLDPCWVTEPFKIISPCSPCSSFEIRSQSVEVCLSTGFKETIECHKSGVVLRSCKKATSLENKKFWAFECISFVIAVLSYFVVYYRSKILERRAMTRVRKQLSSGLSN